MNKKSLKTPIKISAIMSIVIVLITTIILIVDGEHSPLSSKFIFTVYGSLSVSFFPLLYFFGSINYLVNKWSNLKKHWKILIGASVIIVPAFLLFVILIINFFLSPLFGFSTQLM